MKPKQLIEKLEKLLVETEYIDGYEVVEEDDDDDYYEDDDDIDSIDDLWNETETVGEWGQIEYGYVEYKGKHYSLGKTPWGSVTLLGEEDTKEKALQAIVDDMNITIDDISDTEDLQRILNKVDRYFHEPFLREAAVEIINNAL